MAELSTDQIAATLSGHAWGPDSELRLLMLFQSGAIDGNDIEPEVRQESLAKAA